MRSTAPYFGFDLRRGSGELGMCGRVHEGRVNRRGGRRKRHFLMNFGHEQGTEIILVHERIESEALSADHERGWQGCLHNLAALLG